MAELTDGGGDVIMEEEKNSSESELADGGGDLIMEDEKNSSESELEDDDYDLIEENLGVKVQRKKFKRLRRISDDSDDEKGDGQGDDREAIAQHLFDGSDNEEDYRENDIEEVAHRDHYSSDSEGDYSDTDDFIVDDEGQPINENRRQQKRKRNIPDAVVQKAQDVFGVDFDYEEFARYGDQDEYGDGSDNEEESDRQRWQRKKLKKQTMAIHDLYEPDELERAGYTKESVIIRNKDVPERFQLRSVPVEKATDEELDEEAEWIVRHSKFQKAKNNVRFFQPPEPSEANWGNDWDSQTVMSRAVPVVSTARIDDPSEDWEKNTVVGDRNFTNFKQPALPPRPKIGNSGTVAVQSASAVITSTSSDWDTEDWDKSTTVSDANFVNWKRPTCPPVRKSVSAAFQTDQSAPSGEKTIVDDSWANESWETSTTVHQSSNTSNKTPLPSQSIAEIVPPPQNVNESQIVRKVRNVLDFFRNKSFDIPYIAFYKKDYIVPELSRDALWTIYRLDAQFCQLKRRKEDLIKLYNNMKEYLTVRWAQQESVKSDMGYIKMITETHLERVKEIKTAHELNDARHFFNLHYGDYVPYMKLFLKEREQQRQDADHHETVGINPIMGTVSNAIRRKSGSVSAYSKCRGMGFSGQFLQRFGITSEKFAENILDKYQHHEIEQWPVSPLDTATDIVTGQSLQSRPEDVLNTVRLMMAVEIAGEPIVRQCVRTEFFERATINCHPTVKGHHDINESHPCFTMMYLKDKPVKTLTGDQFLKLIVAEKDDLLSILLGENFDYFDEIKQLITRDEFSKTVQEWNDFRENCLKDALENYLVPELRKELREKLLEDCYEHIIDEASRKLYRWLEVAPMKVNYPDEAEVEWDTSQGIRVMAMAYDTGIDFAGVTVAVVRPDGEPDIRNYRHDEEASDRLRLKNMLRVRGEEKDEDTDVLKNYIRDMKPHVVIIAGQSKEAIRLKSDVTQIVYDLVNEDAFPEIRIEIVNNEAAKVYASSKRSLVDLGKDYTLLARQAISLGRLVQDPLLELAQLWNADEDILCVKLHPLQDQVPKELLKERIEIEFVNRTCDVGVDVNRALTHPHTASVVQFVSGLGPIKATTLLQKIRQTPRRLLESRGYLLTHGLVKGTVHINCTGFIRIDVSIFEDADECYLEVLDGTRVHPVCYEYARRMATDALYENQSKANSNLISAVEELIKNPDPEKLNLLALEDYADSLRNQGNGEMLHTLISIREELKAGYKDMRTEYKGLYPEELFDVLTREIPITEGELISATVAGVIRKKLKSKDNDEYNDPIRNTTTGKWQCPSCGKNDFAELSDVWAHMDSESGCPGPAIGVRVFLENGLMGFIPTPKLSDKPVTNPEDRVYPGQKIYCRITKIDKERFSVDCTSRSSDLLDTKDELKPKKDDFYDKERQSFELNRIKEKEENKKVFQRQVYVKRVIVHPAFRNVAFKDVEKLMESKEQGEVIVRPSSKGPNHLTVTWKVTDGVSQHIDVREEGKSSAFSLGQTLLIGEDEFEDIDEIMARHVAPMAGYARDIINYKYYVANLGGSRQKAENYLQLQKDKNNNKIHYVFHASKEYPGKFLLSYLPMKTVVHEFVSVTTDGFRYRQQTFETVDDLLKWFKIHYKDPPPASTPIIATNVAQQSGYTFQNYQASQPGNYPGGTKHSQPLFPPPPSTHRITPTPHYSTPLQGFTPYSTYAGQIRHVGNGSGTPAVTPRVVVTPESKSTSMQPVSNNVVDDDECWE